MLPRIIAGRYKPLAILGQGAFGEVYLCHCSDRQKKLALKLVLRGDSDFQEFRTLRSLKHPNVVQVLAAVEIRSFLA